MLLLCFPISKLDKIKSKPRRNGNSRSANPPELLLKHRTPQIRISCWRWRRQWQFDKYQAQKFQEISLLRPKALLQAAIGEQLTTILLDIFSYSPLPTLGGPDKEMVGENQVPFYTTYTSQETQDNSNSDMTLHRFRLFSRTDLHLFRTYRATRKVKIRKRNGHSENLLETTMPLGPFRQ